MCAPLCAFFIHVHSECTPFAFLCAFAELDETIRLLVNSLHLCFVAAFNMYVCLWVTICVLGGRRAKCQIQNGRTALIGAAEYGHSECVRLLVESGADINANHVRTHSIVHRQFVFGMHMCIDALVCIGVFFISCFPCRVFIAVRRCGVVTRGCGVTAKS